MRQIKKIAAIVGIISVIYSIFSSIYVNYIKSDRDRIKSNLYEKTIQYEDELGRHVTEKTQLQITVKELKKVAKSDSTQLNDYEKQLKKVFDELSASNRKLKNVQNALSIATETRNTFNTKLTDTIVIRDMAKMTLKRAEISNEYGKYSIEYNPTTDSLNMSLKTRNEFFVDIFKERKANKKGKQVFWPVRWLKDWEYKGSIKTLNDSTEITEFSIINIEKR